MCPNAKICEQLKSWPWYICINPLGFITQGKGNEHTYGLDEDEVFIKTH
jgi:hypothetical protein